MQRGKIINLQKLFFFFYFQTKAVHMVCIILLLIGATSNKYNMRDILLKIITIYFALHVLVIMLYDLMKPHLMKTLEDGNFSIVQSLELEKIFSIHVERPIIKRISSYILFIATTSLFYTLKLRQFLRFKRVKPPKLIFEEISRVDADETVEKLIKYLLNYSFYKFGIEVISIVMLLLVSIKMDFMSLLYFPFFILFTFVKKKKLKTICKIATNFCVLMILAQVIGLAVLRTHDFVAIKKTLLDILEMTFKNLEKHPSNLVFDYILLMALSCQNYSFQKSELLDFFENPFIFGGENDETIPPRLFKGRKIYKYHIYYFPEKIVSCMDVIKRLVFKVQYWITIAVLFFAGTNRVDIFSLSYIICSFVFLWRGTDFYLKPLPNLLRHWNILLGFNISAIAAKVCIEIIENVAPGQYCYVLANMNIPCEPNNTELTPATIYAIVGIFWDITAFLFIIVQRRIFMSYYFYNIIQVGKFLL